MPLVVFTGYPSSGKTQRAHELKKALYDKIELDERKPSFQVVLINDESLGIKKDVYGNATKEKAARATMYSAVGRALNKNTIVLCDGMNYIKGYRYQLYCEAKNTGTSYCVIHCGTPINICREWNCERKSLGYPPDVFEELLMRYEEPNSLAKWDSPLFTVIYSDLSSPVDSIWEILSSKKMIKPNASTIVKPLPSSDYLFELNKITQKIIDTIIENQMNHGSESEIKIDSINKSITLSNNVTLSKLQSIRHRFINLNRIQTSSKSKIQEIFIDFLNSHLNEDIK
ncbi:hypothetical protein T552_01371 [Pneumocystis carinii B80]|uniref:Chromatin associated protein KTI12 n=1 Tax=Pneumocystis carinii (strain B80) TaxID=1408658 RepID=A0A0W4ZM08_PNEC8|nr:hypothetical protein T552_01371 [Pneumocystis carinii B80]KTW29420.1 hypothetical protein T552_01371 [Pneumocystis carinii B80]